MILYICEIVNLTALKRNTIKRLLFCSDNSDNFIDLTQLSTTSLCNLQENSAQRYISSELLEYYRMLLVCANAVLLTPQYFQNPKDGLLHIEQTSVVNPDPDWIRIRIGSGFGLDPDWIRIRIGSGLDPDSDWIRIHEVPWIRTEEGKVTQKIENG
jgi:hypothetical protein